MWRFSLSMVFVVFCLVFSARSEAFAPPSGFCNNGFEYDRKAVAEVVQSLLAIKGAHEEERWDAYKKFRKIKLPHGYEIAVKNPFTDTPFNTTSHLILVSPHSIGGKPLPILVLHKGLDKMELHSAPLYEHLPEWDCPILSADIFETAGGEKLYLQVYPAAAHLKKDLRGSAQRRMLRSFGFRDELISGGWRVSFRDGTHNQIDRINQPYLQRRVAQWIKGEFGDNIPLALEWEYVQSHEFSTLLRYPNVFHDYFHYLLFTEAVGNKGRDEFYRLVRRHYEELKALFEDPIEDFNPGHPDPYSEASHAILLSEIFSRLVSIFYDRCVFPKRERFDFSRVIWWDEELAIPVPMRLFLIRLRLFDPAQTRIPSREWKELTEFSHSLVAASS